MVWEIHLSEESALIWDLAIGFFILFFSILFFLLGFETTNTNDYLSSKKENIQKFNRNNSDGSDRDEGDTELDNIFYSDGFDSTNSESYSANIPNDDNDSRNSVLMPKISIRNKLFRLDLVTPKLINFMNENEKETYISNCRQLYSEIYD